MSATVTPLHPDTKLGSDISDTLFASARAGARPYQIAGIAKRLHAVAREIVERYPDCPVARSWANQIDIEVENIEGMP